MLLDLVVVYSIDCCIMKREKVAKNKKINIYLCGNIFGEIFWGGPKIFDSILLLHILHKLPSICEDLKSNKSKKQLV